MKVLFVHGIGDHHTNTEWQADWKQALSTALVPFGQTLEAEFVMLDDLFEVEEIHVGSALAKLAGSLLFHGLGDLFHGGRAMERAQLLDELQNKIRWTAGMVAQWADNDALRKKLRSRVAQAIQKHHPVALMGHSLGSLVCYDTLASVDTRDKIDSSLTFVSFGSQIGNPGVRDTFGGFIKMPNIKAWHHLFHPTDRVLTTRLSVPDPKFHQEVIEFPGGVRDPLGHSAMGYLSSQDSVSAWASFAATPANRGFRTPPSLRRKSRHRALLVGINKYADPTNNLEGCVNDVYLTSASLQSWGFPVDDIRVVLDERATAQGIRDRLEWLLEGAGEGDLRFFHYSGHGTQLPSYGPEESIDRLNECLCPYDFDWTAESSILDDWFYRLYSQLSLETSFVAVLDCCHSGGMTRSGRHTVRGLTPPDDIRHRALRYDAKLEMWVPREIENQRKLGSAEIVRPDDKKVYTARRKQYDIVGPYKPVLLEACQENQLAEEYQDGPTSYGVFTYCLNKALRQAKSARHPISYKALVEQVRSRLQNLGYIQSPPEAVGPTEVVNEPIRFLFPGATTRKRGKGKSKDS